MLAILLDKMGVPYHIFERASKVKPLGKLSIQPLTDISNLDCLRNQDLAGQVSFRPRQSCSHSYPPFFLHRENFTGPRRSDECER